MIKATATVALKQIAVPIQSNIYEYIKKINCTEKGQNPDIK